MPTDHDARSPGNTPHVDRAEMSAFLADRIASDGSVVLTRLPAAGGPATCRAFTAAEPALAWAERWTPTSNIYVANNPPEVGWEPPNASDGRDGGDNPEAKDVALRRRLQLDGDPRDGVSPAEAKGEAARLADDFFAWARAQADALPPTSRPVGVVAPTLQVDSGRGMHLHLDLAHPVESTDFVAEVNKRIVEWFRDRARLTKWDGVHNPARIMRCPGSWNHRTGTHVRVLRRDPAARASFGLWLKVMGAGTSAGAATASTSPEECTSPIEPVATVDALGPEVPRRTQVIIAQGRHPDEPPKEGDDSRSAWMFDAVCWLVRARVPDGKILGALLNPNFGVSDCIFRDGQGVDRSRADAEKYARRQVQRARAEVAKEPPPRARVRLPGGSHQHADTARELAPLMRRRGWCRRGRAVFTLEPGGYLDTVRPHRAVTEFEAVATFYRVSLDKKTGALEEVPDRLSSEVARIVMESSDIFAALPEVKVVHETPVLLLRGGELVPIVGFDEESGILARGDAPPDVSLDDAKSLLSDLLRDWQFQDVVGDRARAVAAIIKPALNASGMLGAGRVPMDVVEADDSQAGKGLLCRTIALIYRSRAVSVAQTRGGVGSVRESVAKNLLEGRPFIQLDNWRGPLDEPFLEAALTEPEVECRAPHKGGAIVDPSGTCFFLTSNGAELTEDLANRSNFVRILKRPEGYQFHPWPEGGIEEHVKANQPRYLGAVWAVLREWHRVGRTLARDDGSHDFRAWARATRYIVRDLLGIGDPLAGNRALQQEKSSPALVWLRKLKVLVAAQPGLLGRELRASDLLDLCVEHGIDVPGVTAAEADALESDAVRDKAVRGVGKRLQPLFRTRSEIVVDNLTVRRVEKPRSGEPGRTDKSYVFGEASARPGGVQAEMPF